jgi:signal transduction histidine kinase
VVWANRALARLAGRRSADELVGLELESLLPGLARGPAGPAVECRLARPDGLAPRVRVLSLPGPAGGLHALALEDVSELRRLEQENLGLGRAAAEASREATELRERLRREAAEREEILTVVSHELRTPVTVISGYNRLLLSEQVGPLNEEQRRFLSESNKSCQRLNAFIANLLEAARDVRGEGALEVCERSLRPTLEGVAAFLKPLLEERGLRLAIVAPPDGSLARFDPLRVEQVLTNLIGNAIKYARPNGTIEVATRALREGERRLVEVSVSDDGPGVPAAESERIFEPYVRVGEGRGAGGLGLGLAICRRIVEAHGGSIRVEDRAPGGSRFVFTLPAPARAGGA